MSFTLEHLTNAEASYYIFVYSLIVSSILVLASVVVQGVFIPFLRFCIYKCV